MMSLQVGKKRSYKTLFAAALAPVLALAPATGLAQDFTKTSHQPTTQTVSLRTHSELVPDEYGTLWFRQGADSNTEYSMAQDVSVEDGGKIAIVAVAAPEIAGQMAQGGRQLRRWLESQAEVDKDVPLVAAGSASQGGGFTFYIDGLRLTTESNPIGVFSPQEAAAELPNVVNRYVATMELNAESNRPPQDGLAMSNDASILTAAR